MARVRTLLLGVGCLLVLLAGLIAALVALGLSSPTLPKQVVLAVNLSGPLPELAAQDPLARFGGGAPVSLRELHAALGEAAHDERVVGLRVHVDSYQGGFATTQEIRSLVTEVSAAGKWTASYLDTAGEFAPGNSAYYLASACDEVSLNPAGDVNLIGLSARSPFLRGTLDKLGIEPEFPGRGDYKTARFLYTERDFTPAHREMIGWLVDSLMGQMVGDIAASREMAPDQVRGSSTERPTSARRRWMPGSSTGSRSGRSSPSGSRSWRVIVPRRSASAPTSSACDRRTTGSGSPWSAGSGPSCAGPAARASAFSAPRT
ncbi:MAG TPA: S49 family peptidase [Thermoanaerobaculales bacterium]|nr:S49 family peptidase [Thermoanaerobaculales bacterium]